MKKLALVLGLGLTLSFGAFAADQCNQILSDIPRKNLLRMMVKNRINLPQTAALLPTSVQGIRELLEKGEIRLSSGTEMGEADKKLQVWPHTDEIDEFLRQNDIIDNVVSDTAAMTEARFLARLHSFHESVGKKSPERFATNLIGYGFHRLNIFESKSSRTDWLFGDLIDFAEHNQVSTHRVFKAMGDVIEKNPNGVVLALSKQIFTELEVVVSPDTGYLVVDRNTLPLKYIIGIEPIGEYDKKVVSRMLK